MERDRENIERILEELERDSFDKYMRICYNVLVSAPEKMLSHKANPLMKKDGIDTLIDYFKTIEEYEKCSELQKLLKMI
jgi:hypothetical protein